MVNDSDKKPIDGQGGKEKTIERRSQVRLTSDNSTDERAVTYKIATEKKEFEDAFSLVWQNYVDTGLQRDDHAGLRFNKYHLLPTSRVFVANFHEELARQRPDQFKGQGKCVGTVTLIIDSPMGLPMDEYCGDETAQMRSEGRKIAEVVAFAVDPTYTKYKVFLHMFRLLFQFAAMKGVTDLCCSVTERHIKFYRKVCLFEPMGDLVPYSGAYKLKVQGHRLDIKAANKKAEEFYAGKQFDANLHNFFFQEGYRKEKGEGSPLSCEFLEYFAREKTDFADTLQPQDLNILRSEYENIGMHFPF